MDAPRTKISNFTIAEPLPSQSVALYNTLTQAVGVLPLEVWVEAKLGNLTHMPTVEHMLGQGFLVPEYVDERLVAAHWRNSEIYDLSQLTYHLMDPAGFLAHAGGLAASGIRRAVSMDTARDIIDFVSSEIDEHRPESVRLNLSWTLDPSGQAGTLVHLAESLHYFCLGRDVAFKINLSARVSPECLKLACQLKQFGLEEVGLLMHSFSPRHGQGGGGELRFQEQILKELAKHANIALIGNLGPAPLDHFHQAEVFGLLAAHGLTDHISKLLNLPRMRLNGQAAAGQGFIECMIDPWACQIFELDQSIGPRPETPPRSVCMSGYRGYTMIDTGGNIVACPMLVGYPEQIFGHVRTGRDFYKEARLVSRALPKKCQALCELAPACDGGCRLMASYNARSLDAVFCNKQLLMERTREYLINQTHTPRKTMSL